MLDGEGQQLVGAAQIELGANVLAVGFHGGRTEEKFRGDFLGRIAERNQPQYTPLRRRQ